MPAHNETEIGYLIRNGHFADAAERVIEFVHRCKGNAVRAAELAEVHHATFKRWIVAIEKGGYDLRKAINRIRREHVVPKTSPGATRARNRKRAKQTRSRK